MTNGRMRRGGGIKPRSMGGPGRESGSLPPGRSRCSKQRWGPGVKPRSRGCPEGSGKGSFRVGCRVENPARDEPAKTVRGRGGGTRLVPDETPWRGMQRGRQGPLPRSAKRCARNDRAHLASHAKAQLSTNERETQTTGVALTITQFATAHHKKIQEDANKKASTDGGQAKIFLRAFVYKTACKSL